MVKYELTRSRYMGLLCTVHPEQEGIRLFRNDKCCECNRIARSRYKAKIVALKPSGGTGTTHEPERVALVEQLRQRTTATATIQALSSKLKYATARLEKNRQLLVQREVELEECRTGRRDGHSLSGLYASLKAAEVRIETDRIIEEQCGREIVRQQGILADLAVPVTVTTGFKYD